MMTWLRGVMPPLSTFVLVTGILELFVRMGWIQDFVLPAPSQVVAVFFVEGAVLRAAAWTTFVSASLGLIASFTTGILVALLLSVSEFLRRAIYPYAVFFQTVPIIAIAPLLVIWFGFGQTTVVISSFIVSVFPVIASTLLGLQSTDPHLVDLFQLLAANRKDYLLKLKFPHALPQIFSGLRIASGLAIIGAIVGEFITGGGLGGVVDAARTQQRIDLVFAAVIASSVLGLGLVAAINYLSWITLRKWHASEQIRGK